ncbi:universal stress protein [Marinivivus vitaminiproducens]|uniref:universal stress protein n=1 Tax=Marinivivus vitaminiproducens TaxID=3035935 RepID=UPI0027A23140|nr:universal stress protein [Geminicoccaceae bacterium SCSIO 64248]
MYKKILVALDLADTVNAHRAIDAAGALAAAGGSTVHLLHVRLPLPSTYARYLPANYDADDLREAKDQMKALAERFTLPVERIVTNLRRGSIYGEILDEAKVIEADLIIIGSHMPSFSSRLLGSNATAVVRDAGVSVLVVRGGDGQTS